MKIMIKIFLILLVGFIVYSGPISTTNSGANGTSIPDETEPLILN